MSAILGGGTGGPSCYTCTGIMTFAGMLTAPSHLCQQVEGLLFGFQALLLLVLGLYSFRMLTYLSLSVLFFFHSHLFVLPSSWP